VSQVFIHLVAIPVGHIQGTSFKAEVRAVHIVCEFALTLEEVDQNSGV
jgi:hypothetical protein